MSQKPSNSTQAPTPSSGQAKSQSQQQPPVDSALPASKPQLEEDDEFEDFPAEDWPDEETDLAASNGAAGTAEGVAGAGAGGTTGPTHLWEESWDDDDTTEDFADMLKEELKKVEASKH